MAKHTIKTNAVRLAESAGIAVECYEYDVKDGRIDGISVAEKIGKPLNQVFKTLVTVSNTKEYLVFVIPVAEALDMKKAAAAAGAKSVEMLPQKELLKVTGYVHGGCSPLGMKKLFRTFLHESAQYQERMVCSAGKVGAQLQISPADLLQLTGGTYADLCK